LKKGADFEYKKKKTAVLRSSIKREVLWGGHRTRKGMVNNKNYSQLYVGDKCNFSVTVVL
jgi:hypothetical protein